MSIEIIKIDHDTYERKALQIAQKEIDEDPSLEEVYIDGDTVSDLCINDNGCARKCTSDEWTKFFYTNISNPNKLCPNNK